MLYIEVNYQLVSKYIGPIGVYFTVQNIQPNNLYFICIIPDIYNKLFYIIIKTRQLVQVVSILIHIIYMQVRLTSYHNCPLTYVALDILHRLDPYSYATYN